jgi:hypothetical protein
MASVDRHGLPLAVSTHAANHHEVTLVQPSFDFYMIEAKPENLIGGGNAVSWFAGNITPKTFSDSCNSQASPYC